MQCGEHRIPQCGLKHGQAANAVLGAHSHVGPVWGCALHCTPGHQLSASRRSAAAQELQHRRICDQLLRLALSQWIAISTASYASCAVLRSQRGPRKTTTAVALPLRVSSAISRAMTVLPQASAQVATPATSATDSAPVAPPIAATLTDEERALLKQKRIAVFGSFQVSLERVIHV